MVGIVSYGAYIPRYRLSREIIARAWGSPSIGGERAVACFDEDTITMASEAAFDCLGSINPDELGGLYFASTTAPYREKQSSSLLSSVLDLKQDIISADFGNSLRAGTSAFNAAIHLLESSNANKISKVLVVSSECRLSIPQSELEQSLGDGSAAFILGNSDTIVNIIGDYSLTDEFTDLWRTEQDIFVNSWDDKFNNVYGYAASVQQAVTSALKKYELVPENFSKLVLFAPNPRQQAEVARRLGFNTKTQLTDSLASTVGNTGTALSSMMLVSALEQAKPGDKLLWVDFGQGVQVFILEVTPKIEKYKANRGIKGYLPSKIMLPNYEMYIQFRKLIPIQEPRTFPSPSSIPLFWRDKKSIYAFKGSKCHKCGLIVHPVSRICYQCRSKDDFEEVNMARSGKIYTYAEDYLADSPVLPQISATIDLDDGARVYLRLTECEAQNLQDRPQKIGMRVELTFRKLGDISGFHSYYWKARPVRGGN